MTDWGIVEQMTAPLPDRDAIEAMTFGERQVLLAELTRSARMIEAAMLDVVDIVDRCGEYRTDGHLTARAWLAAVTNEPRITCSRRVRDARALRDLAQFRSLFRNGCVPVGHIDTIGAAWSNPRVRDDLPVVEDQLVSQIDDTSFGFESFVREFVRLADADGAHQRAETIHDDRRAHLSKVGDRWHLDAVCGPAHGVALKHTFDTYCQAAFDTDRAAAIARNGGRDHGRGPRPHERPTRHGRPPRRVHDRGGSHARSPSTGAGRQRRHRPPHL